MKRFVFIYSILILFICSLQTNGQVITTVAGGMTGHGGYWGDGGAATLAEMGLFGGLAVDDSGNIYIADASNNRIRKVSITSGIINTIAGTGVAGYSGDGLTASVAKLSNPGGVILDNSGNIYISDCNNFRIRKIDISTSVITTFAGNGTFGFSVDGTPATAASFDFGAYCFDIYGNMIIESSHYRVRKIDAFANINTIAGTGVSGYSGDGGAATVARIHPMGYGNACDAHGNIYFCDSMMCIRKINHTTGIITRVAGTGDHIGFPYSGEGGQATDAHITPVAVAVDDTGNLYIVDGPNARIEKVDTFGVIHSIAGTGSNGFGGDGGPATSAKLNYPENVTLDRCGNIYIADFNNKRVRKITYNPTCSLPHGGEILQEGVVGNNTSSIRLYPNPAFDELIISVPNKMCNIGIFNLLGQMVVTSPQPSPQVVREMRLNIANLPKGVYVVKVTDTDGKALASKFLKE